MGRRIYTEEQKAEAIAMAAEVGKAEAARRCGVNAGSLGAWMSRAGVTNADPEGRAKSIKIAREAWLQRRAQLADRMGEVTDHAVEELARRIARKDITGAELVRAIAVLTDRAQLLSGEATNRTEQLTPERTPEQEAELAQVFELGDRLVA